MKKTFGLLLKCVLCVVAVICSATFFIMRASIADTEKQISGIVDRINDQKVRNEEYRSILSDENAEDFYRTVAEDDLGYGEYDEKIYVNIPGK